MLQNIVLSFTSFFPSLFPSLTFTLMTTLIIRYESVLKFNRHTDRQGGRQTDREQAGSLFSSNNEEQTYLHTD